MPTIIPISEIRNSFNRVADTCHSEQEPVFITKNGYSDLVIMSAQTYDHQMARIEVYEKLLAAQKQIEDGTELVEHDTVFAALRAKYGGSTPAKNAAPTS